MTRKGGQKRKKEEKSKTQLKKPKTGPGVHLPKGTNVTKTEIRVGKIVIPKQLEKSSESGPLTKKKLGLKELLSKLNHFSQTVRFESLEGLKELVTGEQGGNLVEGHLAVLVAQLAPLTSDREGKVRRSAIAILQAVLAQVSCSRLEPLFPVLTAHLSCCLTHIKPGIQQDGLNLIDSLVSTVPAFIADHFARILPDCLEQISSKKSGQAAGKVGVSIAVSDKISALQWRIDVLSRVDKILEIIVNNLKTRSDEQEKLSSDSVQLEFKDCLPCPLYPAHPAPLLLSDLGGRSGQDPMLPIVDQILPLILESWVEVTSAEKQQRRVNFIANDAFPLLENIARILERLVTYSQLAGMTGQVDTLLEKLKSKYYEDLYSRLLSHLPYSNSSGRCNAQNILLARVTLALAGELDQDLLSRILGTVCTHGSDSADRFLVFENLLDRDLGGPSSRLTVIQVLQDLCLTGSSPTQRTRALRLLTRLAETEAVLGAWLQSLPTLLVNSGPEDTRIILESMLKFAKRRETNLVEAFNLSRSKLEDWSLGLETEEKMFAEKMLFFIGQHCN